MRLTIKIISVLFLLISSLGAVSQDSLYIPISEILPRYPGGEIKLREFIDSNLVYPVDAISNQKSGRVYVFFIVEPDGTTSSHSVDGGITPSYGMNEEALRVVKLFTGFEPGTRNGKAISQKMIIPIVFELDEKVIEKK